MLRRDLSASRRSCVSWVILGCMLVLILVGLVSGGGYLYLRLGSGQGWIHPLQRLREDRVEPSLALLALSGVRDLEVANRALAQQELETAYASVVLSTQLDDGERIGTLLLLAGAYATAGDKSAARLCYQQANLVATLSPTLSDSARADAYLGIGEGLAELGDNDDALLNYDQAHVVASHSLYIKDPHRADVLGELGEAYERLGESGKASECLAEQAEIQYVFDESGEGVGSAPEQPVSPFMMEIPEPTEAMLSSYQQRRMESVQRLIDSLEEGSGKEAVPEEVMSDVAQALLNEDDARLGIYEEQLAGASSLVLKIGIARAKVDWLIIKYRAALGGYGLQLVPAWTDGLADIEAELNAAYGALLAAYDEQIGTFSDDTAVDRAWLHLLRFQIEQGRLGLYPDYPQEELLSQLTEVTERLVASGAVSLRVEVEQEGDNPLFRLAAAE